MFCLNKRAHDRLAVEIQHLAEQDRASKAQQQLALKRLAAMSQQPGTPLTEVELRALLKDIFPTFRESVLSQAARANRPPRRPWKQIQWAILACAGIAGSVWVLNLPYPMIRIPVSKTMPMILLPSFISMDSHYRQAIASTEQADQLVNRATSVADFALGAEKVKAAQQHLDALPVWFLGYYPSTYCSWFQCGWRFTLDEFEQARKEVARMDARLFQERNAQTQLEKVALTIDNARQAYQKASQQGDKEAAIAHWQQSMDQLEQVPRETLAGRSAQTQLVADERDFQQVVGFTRENLRTGHLIQAAQLTAETAQKFSSKPTQSVAEWQEAEGYWKDAIAKLDEIKVEDPDYIQARKLLNQYQAQLSQVRIRSQQEEESVQVFNRAQTIKEQLFASIQPNASVLTPKQVAQLHQIIDLLEKVKKNTTVYPEARRIQNAAIARLHSAISIAR